MSMFTDRVTANIEGHGIFWAAPAEVDRVMERYLPASPAMLRAIVEERTGNNFADVTSVSALLLILADMEVPV